MLSEAQHELRTLRSTVLNFISTVGARKFIGTLKAIVAGEHLMVKLTTCSRYCFGTIKELNIDPRNSLHKHMKVCHAINKVKVLQSNKLMYNSLSSFTIESIK